MNLYKKIFSDHVALSHTFKLLFWLYLREDMLPVELKLYCVVQNNGLCDKNRIKIRYTHRRKKKNISRDRSSERERKKKILGCSR